MIFIGMALTVLLFSGLYGQSKLNTTKQLLWIVSCLLMFSLLAFRNARIGTDTLNYVTDFNKTARQTLEYTISHTVKDVGYYILSKGLSCISVSPVWYLSATAFLSCFGIWDYIKRNSVNPVLSLFFYIVMANYHFSFTGIRQAIAMSLCAFSMRYVEKRKLIPFVIVVLLASTIHKSALLFLPTFLLPLVPLTPATGILGTAGTVVCLFAYNRFSARINLLLGYQYTVERVANGYYYFILVLAIVVVGYIYRKKWVRNKDDLLSLSASSVSLMALSFRLIDRIAERPSMFWQATLPVTVVNSLGDAKRDKNAFVIMLGFIAVAFGIFAKRALGWEYMFFWETVI